jgi:hypothetical protein
LVGSFRQYVLNWHGEGAVNPLLILGGLGILGFLMMGYKKKPTSRPWEGADESDPSEGQPYQGSRLPPGFGSGGNPDDPMFNRFTVTPERLA